MSPRSRSRGVLWRCVSWLAAAALTAGGAGGPVASVVRAEPAPQTGPVAAGQRLLYTVRGTPHEWLADERGALHWVGDGSALARVLYPPQTYTLADPLDQSLRHSLDHPAVLEYEQLLAAPRGAPLLSTPLLALDGELYQPHWPALAGQPTLRRVGGLGSAAAPADLAVLGVRPEDVLDATAWEARYHQAPAMLPKEELRPAGPRAAPPAPCQPVVLEISIVPNGAEAQLHNPCAEPLRAALSAVLYDAPGGRPLATTNTTSVTLVPGETQPARVSAESRRDRLSAERAEQGMPPLPMAPQASPTPPKPPIVAGWVAPLLSAGPPPPEGQREERQFPFDLGFEFEAGAGAARPAPTPPAEVCLDVAARGCLHVDPRLRQTVEVLRGVEMGASLLAEAADFGVTVRRAALFGNLGQYENRSRTITIAASLDELSDWERAAVLAHELQHVHDHLRGLLPTSTQSECVARERAAFGREARFWRELWQGQLPDARDSVQDSLNRSVSEAEDDPQAYARSLARLYRHQCDR